jgi:hypothetical protein
MGDRTYHARLVPAIFADVLPPLRERLDALIAGGGFPGDEVAAIIIGDYTEVALPVGAARHVTPNDYYFALVRLSEVTAICDGEAPAIAKTLRQPPRQGRVWCVLFWRDRAGYDRVLAVPIATSDSVRTLERP